MGVHNTSLFLCMFGNSLNKQNMFIVKNVKLQKIR